MRVTRPTGRTAFSSPRSLMNFARRNFGGKGIRTPDIQLAKLALYQLSYAPFGNSECRMSNVECRMQAAITVAASLCEAWECAWPRKPALASPTGRRLQKHSAARAPVPTKIKMPDGLGPSGILIVDLQQRLNCALPFQSSSSLGFFRFQGLNGITKIPKNFGLSRRPSAEDRES